MFTSIRRAVWCISLLTVFTIIAPAAAVRADCQDDSQRQQEEERCAAERRQRELDEWAEQQRRSADEWQQQHAEELRRMAEERQRDQDEWNERQRKLNDESQQQQAEQVAQPPCDNPRPPVVRMRAPARRPIMHGAPDCAPIPPVACQPVCAPAPAPTPALVLPVLSPEENAAGKFDLAMLLADAGQAAHAVEFCTDIVKSYPGTPAAGQAQAYLDKNN